MNRTAVGDLGHEQVSKVLEHKLDHVLVLLGVNQLLCSFDERALLCGLAQHRRDERGVVKHLLVPRQVDENALGHLCLPRFARERFELGSLVVQGSQKEEERTMRHFTAGHTIR